VNESRQRVVENRHVADDLHPVGDYMSVWWWHVHCSDLLPSHSVLASRIRAVVVELYWVCQLLRMEVTIGVSMVMERMVVG